MAVLQRKYESETGAVSERRKNDIARVETGIGNEDTRRACFAVRPVMMAVPVGVYSVFLLNQYPRTHG